VFDGVASGLRGCRRDPPDRSLDSGPVPATIILETYVEVGSSSTRPMVREVLKDLAFKTSELTTGKPPAALGNSHNCRRFDDDSAPTHHRRPSPAHPTTVSQSKGAQNE
jgi:hypothetical protein